MFFFSHFKWHKNIVVGTFWLNSTYYVWHIWPDSLSSISNELMIVNVMNICEWASIHSLCVHIFSQFHVTWTNMMNEKKGWEMRKNTGWYRISDESREIKWLISSNGTTSTRRFLLFTKCSHVRWATIHVIGVFYMMTI